MRLIIAGDFCISPDSFTNNIIDPSVIELFKNSDFNVVNLECPITQKNDANKILKTGPHLCGDARIFEILKSLNVRAVTLANNHIMDYGNIGLIDTIEACKSLGIQRVGAGKDIDEASKTLYVDNDDRKVAIINFCENEWSTTVLNDMGANPLDIIDNTRQIRDAKQQADHVLVIVHGGHEYYNLPSPRMQKLYRFFVDQGADMVIGHHTHCMSGYEIFKGVPIYYSLGNFLFMGHSQYDGWYEGLLLEININDGKISSLLHPVQQHKKKPKLELQTGNDKSRVFEKIKTWNSCIVDEKKLKQEWDKFIEMRSESYLYEWSPLSFIPNKYLSSLFNKLGWKMLNKKGVAIYLNLLLCEAHKDISVEILKKYLKK